MTSALSVLVVEDDAVLRELLEMNLRAERFRVRATDDGNEALGLCDADPPDVVVLDVMLPGRSGLEVCSVLSSRERPPGVILVTANGAESDIVLGLEAGADDYVVKPVRVREIVARVRALARRLSLAEGSERGSRRILRRRDLVLDLDGRCATVGANEVPLTPKEFDVLALLAGTPERVWSRSELLLEVWDTDHEGYARNVDVHVMRVRKKLESVGFDASSIETKHGVGYRFRT